MTLGAFELKDKDKTIGVILTEASEKDIHNAMKAVKVLSDLYVNIDIQEHLIKILKSLGFKTETGFIRKINLEELNAN